MTCTCSTVSYIGVGTDLYDMGYEQRDNQDQKGWDNWIAGSFKLSKEELWMEILEVCV